MHGEYTFSSLSTTGGGFAAVTAAAISAPIACASRTDRPGMCTNSESVSPYTTLQFHAGFAWTIRIARSNVSRPHCTIASASSAIGIRPLNPAAAYPYVTFAISFKPICRAFNARLRAFALAGARFSAALTITRVSRISVKSLGRTPGRADGVANTAPLGAQYTPPPPPPPPPPRAPSSTSDGSTPGASANASRTPSFAASTRCRSGGLSRGALPKHVLKHRLYAMTMDGYNDWKSSTATGSEYILLSGSMTSGRHSIAGCLATCSLLGDTAR
eukprot:31529-Pelagococcus_subviridis.AAC.34